MVTGKLGFDKMSKNGHNGMVMANLFFTLHLGVIYWICVSMDHVVNVTKSHGQRICLGIGLLGDFKKA